MKKRVLTTEEKQTLTNLKAEIEKIYEEKEAFYNRVREAWDRYDEMEGMYASSTEKYFDKYEDNHFSPWHTIYHFEEGMAEKEREERENYKETVCRVLEREYDKFEDECWNKIDELENKISIIQYGMTTEEYKLRKKIEKNNKYIERLKNELKECKENNKKYYNQLKKYNN